MRQFRVYDGSEVVEEGEVEMTWEEVRQIRDKELSDSDWRALKDVTLSTAWRDYRQALRDIPQDNDTSNDAADNWPVMPDE